MNKVILIGRLTKDPELRFTAGSGMAVSRFRVAVNRRKKEDGGEREKRRKTADERDISFFGCFCVASFLCASLFSVRIFSQGDCFGDFDCFDRGLDTSGHFCWLHSIDFPDTGY